jgi:Family of unknown function (DUF1028)
MVPLESPGPPGIAGPAAAGRPLHTYSIVARDPATGELGVAVQSHWLAVGTVAPWAEAGAGAVARHSFAEPYHGPWWGPCSPGPSRDSPTATPPASPAAPAPTPARPAG